jgi:phosphoribosylformylglycinamidine cyclo-ligase
VQQRSWTLPPLFRLLQGAGKVSSAEMLDVFNLGVGMIAVLPPADISAAQRAAADDGIKTWLLGEIRSGSRGVTIID